MNTEEQNKNKRIFKGVVVSDSMDKTLVVEVRSMKVHPKYKKRYAVTKRYHVHDENGAFKKGDTVNFKECRPLSKTKRWFAIVDKK